MALSQSLTIVGAYQFAYAGGVATTQEDAVGRKWYISSEGYLIGQLDESFVTA